MEFPGSKSKRISGRINLFYNERETNMNEPTLIILAAGMGSRYGGLKQIDPIGPNGEIIIDYSIYDAKRAGFKKVVFLIAPHMAEAFQNSVGKRVEEHMEVLYAFQEANKYLPEGYVISPERKKPWGTGHAVLCCRDKVEGPFAIINADDYYGPSAFEQIYKQLSEVEVNKRPMQFFMVSYMLGKTVTNKGSVARGVCVCEGDSLSNIVERTYVVNTENGPAYSTDKGETLIPIPENTPVSMNFWGFTPALFDVLEEKFPIFINEALKLNPNDEMYIPNVVGEMLREGTCTVKVMQSRDEWHGVTYKEDKPEVVKAILNLISEGVYPHNLWS